MESREGEVKEEEQKVGMVVDMIGMGWNGHGVRNAKRERD